MPRATEVAKKATFTADDKRGQYARLVAFNHGVKEKIIAKTKDVNSATNTEIEKAGKSLAGGNLLDGPDGIALITALSKSGATDDNVKKNGLTKAYAQEVRPFIRRLQFAPSFGRRGKKAAPKEAKASAGKKGTKASKAKAAPAEAAAPVADAA